MRVYGTAAQIDVLLKQAKVVHLVCQPRLKTQALTWRHQQLAVHA